MTTTSDDWGLLVVDGALCALAIDTLAEVVPTPREYDAVAVAATGLLGTMTVRDEIVPVVSWSALRGGDVRRSDDQVVALLRVDGRTIGLLADAVVGLASTGPGSVQPLESDDRLVTGLFEDRAGRGIASVLDARALVEWPGLPRVDARRTTDSADDGNPALADELVELLFFRASHRHLAIQLVDIAMLLPDIAVLRSVLEGGLCRGTTAAVDQVVAVVDPLLASGLGEMPGKEIRHGVLVHASRGDVALAATHVTTIDRVALSTIGPVAEFAMRGASRLIGVCTYDGIDHLVLDTAALRSLDEVDALSALSSPLGATPGHSGQDGNRVVSAHDHICYDAGHRLATPLEQIDEAVECPPLVVQDISDDPRVIGLAHLRTGPTPVVDLAACLGIDVTPHERHRSVLLVVTAGGQRVAFAVDGLRTIEKPRWVDPHHVGSPDPTDLRCARLIELSQDAGRSLVPTIDLRAIVTTVLADGERHHDVLVG